MLAAAGVETRVSREGDYTPTPALSRAILTHNDGRKDGLADGIIITPSHNPPRDGGFKYNPPHGGPADTDVTDGIQARANELLRARTEVRRLRYPAARQASTTREHDFLTPYVEDLAGVIDVEAIAHAKVKIGADPMGGASVQYWPRIAERYRLDLTVVNKTVDPRFAFMPLDHDGKIRMDCSSPYAMANLIHLKDKFAVAFGNDTDADRHGIVTPTGLMNPNHYLAVAIGYLFAHRPGWPAGAAVGKTLVSSTLIDRGGRQPGPQAARGAGGVQVVRRRAARRQHRLRRRRERRRQLLAPRRPRPHDRQGRPDSGFAGRRDHRGHRPPSGRCTTKTCARSSGRRTTRASTRRPRPPKKTR